MPELDAPAPRAAGKKPRRLKQLVRRLQRWAAGRLGQGCSTLLGSRGREGFGVLMYHRVAPWGAPGDGPTWNVLPERFREQIAGLLERGYVAWPLREALAASRAGRPIPRKAFVVTFDDGYENAFTRAWPILRELGVPATVFVATAYLDSAGPFPFDDWPAAGSAAQECWKPLTTAQTRELTGGGLVELGSHTHTHQDFRGRPAAFAEDLGASLDVLRLRFGLTEAAFSFPFGIAGGELTEAVRRAGLSCALTTRAGLVMPGSDAFAWARFAVEQADTAGTIAAQLGRLVQPGEEAVEASGRAVLAGARPGAVAGGLIRTHQE